MIFTVLLVTFVTLFLVVYRHLTKQRGIIEELNFPVVKPSALFGSPPYDWHNYWKHLEYQERFQKYGKTYAYYEGTTPVLATIDPEIIKSVLVKNFDSFTDIIQLHIDDKYQTLDVSGGETWKGLRKGLSPTFTSGKLKSMLEPMADVADKMISYIDEIQAKDSIIEVKHVFQGMAMNTIGQCAFGIDLDAYKNPNQDLIKYGTEIFQEFRSTNWTMSLILQTFFHFPVLAKFVSFIPAASDKINDITRGIMKQREDAHIISNDFISRLMEMKKQMAENPNAENLKALNDDIITAQGVIFFIAGYETTANTLSTFSYHLAKNPKIQQTIFEEICEVMERHDGKIDHETINDMEYLDAALQENLRINGPVTLHFRFCNKDCEVVPGVVIKKDTRVDMPVYACHHHPEYFPNPEKFQPERFLKENKKDMNPYTYRPFGGGPRVCIGQRFAWVEMKLAVAKLLQKYQLIETSDTKLEPYKGDPFLFSFSGIKMKFKRR